MAIMEISVIPIGTRKTSISSFVASSDKVLAQAKGIKSEITAMGTIVESNSLEKLLHLAGQMHKKVIAAGAKRVVTSITIDERLDKKSSIESKVDSVKHKLKII